MFINVQETLSRLAPAVAPALCPRSRVPPQTLFPGEEEIVRTDTLTLAKQELHVESLNECIGELQRQTEEQRLALQDAQYGFVESRREQVRLQERKSSPKYSNSKYARNGRNQKSQCKS